jgi:hypothetical protein
MNDTGEIWYNLRLLKTVLKKLQNRLLLKSEKWLTEDAKSKTDRQTNRMDVVSIQGARTEALETK